MHAAYGPRARACQKILWCHAAVVDVVPPFPNEIELSNYLRAPEQNRPAATLWAAALLCPEQRGEERSSVHTSYRPLKLISSPGNAGGLQDCNGYHHRLGPIAGWWSSSMGVGV